MTRDEFTASILLLGGRYLPGIHAWEVPYTQGFIWGDNVFAGVGNIESDHVARLLQCELYRSYTFEQLLEFIATYLESIHDIPAKT